MHTMASKNSSANGSDRASAWTGNTPSSTPASRMRCRFSEALNQRSVAQTCTPNARPQPRSSTRMPGRKSISEASHSLSHSGLAAPLTLARTHSGSYFAERRNRSETNGLSEIMRILPLQLKSVRVSALVEHADGFKQNIAVDGQAFGADLVQGVFGSVVVAVGMLGVVRAVVGIDNVRGRDAALQEWQMVIVFGR